MIQSTWNTDSHSQERETGREWTATTANLDSILYTIRSRPPTIMGSSGSWANEFTIISGFRSHSIDIDGEHISRGCFLKINVPGSDYRAVYTARLSVSVA